LWPGDYIIAMEADDAMT